MRFEAKALVCAAALVGVVGCRRPANAQKVFATMRAAACAGDATGFFAHVAEDRFVDNGVKDAWQKDITEKSNGSEICGWSYVATETVSGRDRVEVRSKAGDKKFVFFDKVGGELKLVDFQAIGGTSPTPSAIATATSTDVSQAAPPPSSSGIFSQFSGGGSRLGEHVVFADADWVVIEARNAGKSLKSNSEFNEETRHSDGRFIQVHYRVVNKTSKEQMILDRPKLVDEKGREFGPIDMESFFVPPKSKTIGLDTLQPDIAKEYWTVIEVPADATGLKFKVHGFDLVGPSKTIDVGL